MPPMKLTLAILSLSGLSLLLGAGSLSAASASAYPLKTCVVTGNDLGSMGRPITKVYDGQEVKFCCKPCIKKFDADPAKYLSKLAK